MKTNSIYDDFWAVSKGKPFPFEKYGIEWDNTLNDKEKTEVIKKQLIKAGLEEDLAIELLAKTFDPEQTYY